MKCPNDQTEMEKGIQDRGMWIQSEPRQPDKTLFGGKPIIPVIAWRCPKCGKIELSSEV